MVVMSEMDRTGVNPVIEQSTDAAIQLIEVVREKGTTKFKKYDQIKQTNLSMMFAGEKVRNKKVAILSIVGNARRGKSFLLNFFVRYLEWRETKDAGLEVTEDWLRNDEPLKKNFVWRRGKNRETKGIWMYHKPFVISNSQNEKIAIILIDTEGVFNSSGNAKSDSNIFAVSTFFSSMQIYNLKQDIQEIDLQVIKNFAAYSQVISNANSRKQNYLTDLMFVVRDWEHTSDHSFGTDGGKEYLDGIFKDIDDIDEENKSVRKEISSAFPKISCSLLPHPGSIVVMDSFFEGTINDIDVNFLTYTKELVESTVEVLKDSPKRIDNEDDGYLYSQYVIPFFESLVKICNSDDLPKPDDISSVYNEMICVHELGNVVRYYFQAMEEKFGNVTINTNCEFEKFNKECKSVALERYRQKTAHIIPNKFSDDEIELFLKYDGANENIDTALKRDSPEDEEGMDEGWSRFIFRHGLSVVAGIAIGATSTVAAPLIVSSEFYAKLGIAFAGIKSGIEFLSKIRRAFRGE